MADQMMHFRQFWKAAVSLGTATVESNTLVRSIQLVNGLAALGLAVVMDAIPPVVMEVGALWRWVCRGRWGVHFERVLLIDIPRAFGTLHLR